MQNVKRIESYGLYDFCQDLEAAFEEGYVFDFDTNENFPTAYGTMFTCGLVKPTEKVEEKAEEVTETVTETSQTEEVVQNTEQTEEVVTEETKVETEVQETAEAAPTKRGPKSKAK